MRNLIPDGTELILASGSPRRQELLQLLGLSFRVQKTDASEDFPEHLKGADIARFLAGVKARAIQAALQPHQLALTADTIVCIGDAVLNKPVDEAEARAMLLRLSGQSHEVITACALVDASKMEVFHHSTRVRFRNLEMEEIAYYIKHYQPFDKAGAYGIQEWIGLVGVDEIQGSYFTVMGLPVHLVYRQLRRWFESTT
jgi:septum formation protein